MSEAHRTTEWSRARAIAKPRLQALIDSGNGWCHDGRHRIEPGTRWDVSHIVSVAAMKANGVPASQWHQQQNLTSSCSKHNRSVGGTAGAIVSNATRKAKARFPNW